MNKRIIETVDLGTGEQQLLTIDANAELSVGGEPVWSVSGLGDGIVALTTALRTVHIGAADYWRLLHGDVPPSARAAGKPAAQLAHVRAPELIAQLDQEESPDNAFYPSIVDMVASRTRLWYE